MWCWRFDVQTFIRAFGMERPDITVTRIKEPGHLAVGMTLHTVTIGGDEAILLLSCGSWDSDAAHVAYRQMGGRGNLVNAPIMLGDAIAKLTA